MLSTLKRPIQKIRAIKKTGEYTSDGTNPEILFYLKAFSESLTGSLPSDLKIKVSVGCGRATHFPWVAILPDKARVSRELFFPAFIFCYYSKMDLQLLLLSLTMGGEVDAYERLEILKLIERKTGMPQVRVDHGKSSIYAKKNLIGKTYTMSDLPNASLERDLRKLVSLYLSLKRNEPAEGKDWDGWVVGEIDDSCYLKDG